MKCLVNINDKCSRMQRLQSIPGPSGKIPKGRPVGSVVQHKTIKTFTVRRSGPQNEISSAPLGSLPLQQQSNQPPGINLCQPGMNVLDGLHGLERLARLARLDGPNRPFQVDDIHPLPHFVHEAPASVPLVGLEELIEELDHILSTPRQGTQ